MQRGDIYLHLKFEFKDSYPGKKYIILLNNPRPGEDFIFVKTTSQRENKPRKPGCTEELCLYFIPAKTTFFPEDTWVQLRETYPMVDLDKDPLAKPKGALDPKITDLIVKCLLFGDSDEIPAMHRNTLNRSLKPTQPDAASQKSLQMLQDRFKK